MSAALIDTLKKMPIRTLLCGRFLHIKKEDLPQHVLWIESAPHDWLLPKVAAVVHHGGSGTTHAGLIAGKPTLIVPFLLDQFHWAAAIEDLGAGPKSIPAAKFTQKAFEEGLAKLLNTPSYRMQAEVLSQKMVKEDGIERVIELLEQECKTHRAFSRN